MASSGELKAPISPTAVSTFSVGDDGTDIGYLVDKIRWESFVNNGYKVEVVIHDANYNVLSKITGGDSKVEYLKNARKKPVKVKFKIGWEGIEDGMTEERTAFLIGLDTKGKLNDARVRFIAIDPPSFLLNVGNADGRAYKGSVSEVIEQVIEDFAGSIEANISETEDNKEGVWHMMRMDPKTFIRSLLRWSSSITRDRTRWLVASTDNAINILQESELARKVKNDKKGDLGIYTVSARSSGSNAMAKLTMDNYISVYQTRLKTSGISSTTGEFLDEIFFSDQTVVDDDNTEKKVSVETDATRSFTKPDNKDWATHIESLPELSGGAMGLSYDKYIDGCARQTFISMLSNTMRLRLKVHGDPQLDSSELLGVTKCCVQAQDLEGKSYFIHGNWLVYGFKHCFDEDMWYTYIYCYRLDHDAEATII